jgi:fused signal recognition particle receptor
MVFNWFRRKFDQSEAEPAQESEQLESSEANVVDELEDDTAAADLQSTEPELASEAVVEVATDYLAWAKVAYQNIQQQQESSPAAIEQAIEIEQQSTIPEIDSIVISTDIDADADIVMPVAAAAQVESLKPPVVSDLDSVTSQVERELELISEPAPAIDNLPIWAREDRQQRIDQLKATAIKTVEPAAPDLALDEDFLWSAKVLADQGRTPEQVSLDEINWLKKLRQGLDKTRRGFVNQFKALIGQGPLNADAVESIETLLLQADVGVEATDYVIETLQAKLRQESLPPEEAVAYLKQILRDLLDKPYQQQYTQEFLPVPNHLNIWLVVGVNGVGKTTTIGKLAHMTQASGYKCLIAAGDTFRAAAVEQVKVWGARSGIEVIANPGQNTDPAAVVYDAISAAQARGTELLLVDTAGRLQNKKNLMDELTKIRRIIDKQSDQAQIESLLVLDATLGQNGLRQAQVFAEAAKLSGVVLTKLDGTAKGGVALAVVQQLGLPIRFIGAGEGIEDLRPFSSYEFVEALLSG